MALPLTLACSHYDRTEGLRDGSVRVEGVDLTYVDLPVEEIFFRMARFQEFDAAELSLSSYVLGMNAGSPFVAIPVFPSRAFRHSGIYVNSATGITDPQDLVGATVGAAEYQLTANVWIRGILRSTTACRPPRPAIAPAGCAARVVSRRCAWTCPRGSRSRRSDRTRRSPRCWWTARSTRSTPAHATASAGRRPARAPAVHRRPHREERYFAATGVFPIMHVVAMRRTATPSGPQPAGRGSGPPSDTLAFSAERHVIKCHNRLGHLDIRRKRSALQHRSELPPR